MTGFHEKCLEYMRCGYMWDELPMEYQQSWGPNGPTNGLGIFMSVLRTQVRMAIHQ
jgi:hypothetical protein